MKTVGGGRGKLEQRFQDGDVHQPRCESLRLPGLSASKCLGTGCPRSREAASNYLTPTECQAQAGSFIRSFTLVIPQPDLGVVSWGCAHFIGIT